MKHSELVPSLGRHRLQRGRVQHGEARLEIGQRLRRRGDEHVAGEEAVPGALADHAQRQAIARVGAGMEILDPELARAQVRQHLLLEALEVGLVDGGVDVAPPDVVARGGLVDDELVLRGAAGVLPGQDHKGAALGEMAEAALQAVFDQCRRVEIPKGRLAVGDAV